MSSHYSIDDDGAMESVNFESEYDARLLSQATSQATIAAKSILSSGGTEKTALKTAKAAAQGVLMGNEKDLGNGPKGMLRRRKIKQQAEVIASMALVSASNSYRQGTEWDLLSNTESLMDHKLQMMQVQYDMSKSPSVRSHHAGQAISFDNRSVASGSHLSMSSRNVGHTMNTRPIGVPAGGRVPNNLQTSSQLGRGAVPEAIKEEPSGSLFSMTSAEEEEEKEGEKDITRQVAIRIETTRKPRKEEVRVPRSTKVETGPSGEDLGYFMDNFKNSKRNKNPYRDHSSSDEDGSTYSDDLSSESIHSRETVESRSSSFMASTILSLTNAFQCRPDQKTIDDGAPSPTTKDHTRTRTGKESSNNPAPVLDNSRPSSSCSSVESDELFRSLKSYEDYVLSEESQDSLDEDRRGESNRRTSPRRREQKSRQGPDRSLSQSDDDSESSSGESEDSEECYKYAQPSKKNTTLKKPWKLLKGVSRRKNQGANPYE